MDLKECNYRNLGVTVIIFLLTIIILLGANLFILIQEKYSRSLIAKEVLISIDEIEKKRVEAFSDYAKDLDSYQTKSVYHQMYHASNAQLKLTNLLVQENQLLVTLIAGRK